MAIKICYRYRHTKTEQRMYQFTIIALAVTGVILGPVFSIWSLNLLFGLQIPLNIWTWLSAAWLQLVITSNRPKTEKS